jgi:hypothetical protein
MHGDESRAILWFGHAVAHDPRETTARQNLVALLLKHERFLELVAVMEKQVEVFGELPGLLCVLGQALHGSGRPEAAIRTLLRAKDICKEPNTMATIDEHLRKARAEPPELDTRRQVACSNHAATHDEFTAALDQFGEFVKSERRMSFWTTEDKKRKFVSRPEQHGKILLHTFLRGRFGDSVTILEELSAGAGILDLWVEVPGGMRLVIELKMCGGPYTSVYAEAGVEQLVHYMDNKKSHIGHLVVFDARQRDFGTGIEPIVKSGPHQIHVRFVDIRPDVIARQTASRRANKPKPSPGS